MKLYFNAVYDYFFLILCVLSSLFLFHTFPLFTPISSHGLFPYSLHSHIPSVSKAINVSTKSTGTDTNPHHTPSIADSFYNLSFHAF